MLHQRRNLSERLEKLRQSLGQLIPPMNGAESELLALDLSRTLMAYVNWAHRLIKARPRRVEYARDFWRGPKAAERGGEVMALAALVKQGADLSPYLSNFVNTNGFAGKREPLKRRRGPNWSDKDFALNAYHIHHLHFVPDVRGKRGAEPGRLGHLLYAEFARDEAFFLMVGDHKSFDDGTLEAAVIGARAAAGTWDLVGLTPPPAEDGPSKFPTARHGFATTGEKDGKVIMGALLSTAGTSGWHTRHADWVHHCLTEIDPLLDSLAYVQKLFGDARLPVPENPDFEWMMDHTELSLVETTSRTKFIIVPGFN